MRRKTRTREHIIADYSSIHFERFALDCGYSVEHVHHDYGFDLLLFTYNEAGEFENGMILVQLKATDSPQYIQDGTVLSLDVACSDLAMWREETMPVILVLYDASQEEAYWIHVQEYLRGNPLRLEATKTKAVHFRVEDRLDATAMREFARRKNAIHKNDQEGIQI